MVSKASAEEMLGCAASASDAMVDIRVYIVDAGVALGERTRRRGTRGVLETLEGRGQYRC